MDLTTLTGLTDDDLHAARVAVLEEVDRRSRLADIPRQVTSLTQAYVTDGGDPADISAAVTDATESPT